MKISAEYLYLLRRGTLCRSKLQKVEDFLVSANFAEVMTPKLHKMGNVATGGDTSTLD